jgi:maltose alpha-D-glucosyltransferase/alpha-amylase
MMRSFDYAVQSVLLGLTSHHGRSQGLIREEDRPILSLWATAWYDRVSRTFHEGYIENMEWSDLLPQSESSRKTLLDTLMLEKALVEVDMELSNRPEWLIIPLQGALRLLGYDVTDQDLAL